MTEDGIKSDNPLTGGFVGEEAGSPGLDPLSQGGQTGSEISGLSGLFGEE